MMSRGTFSRVHVLHRKICSDGGGKAPHLAAAGDDRLVSAGAELLRADWRST